MPTLKAQERLLTGNVSEKDVYAVALLATGSEEEAADILAAKLKHLNSQKSKGG